MSRGSAVLAILVGVLVLTGWAFDIPALKSVAPGFVSMKANTALGFLLLGIAMLLAPPLAARSRAVAAGRLAAALAALLGLATLAEYVFDLDLGIDQLLFSEDPQPVRTTYPGRMSPVTALGFSLLGPAAALRPTPTRPWLVQALALPPIALSTLSLVGYAYGAEAFQGLAAYTPLAVHTAATFVVVGVGLLAAFPDRGFAALYRQRTAGGLVFRRLLPAAVALPILLGWARLQGENLGLYDTRFGVALHTLLWMAFLIGLILWSAASLNRLETERDRAEAERDRYFRESRDLHCVAGTDGYFKRLNPAWEATLGLSIEELLSRPYLEFVHPADREATVAEASKLAGGADVVSFENRYRCGDASYRWLEWTARAPRPDGSLIYANARDVSERKRSAEEIGRLNQELERRLAQLAAANQELEAFSYSVSHDLRAPLRAIEGFSRVLLEDCAAGLDPEGQRYLNVVIDSTRRMSRLIDDLLSLSRAGRQALDALPIDMAALAASVAAELEQGYAGRPLELRVGELAPARGDPSLIRQVFVNLLDNACKFSRGRNPARVEVGCRNDGAETTYYVKDNGVGFDMRYAHKLFGVFQRLHTQDEFEGTGVGLALVQRILGRHGGRVWAEGAVDEGATFYFTLPGGEGNDA